MSNTYSQTYAGIIVLLLSEVLPKLGLTLGTDQLTTTVYTITSILGAAWAFYGRYRLGGINALGLKTQ